MPHAIGTVDRRTVATRPAVASPWPLRPGVIITAAALLGLGLRVFQLTRPGYLTGFTQYDDGVYIGNSLRLVNGVIPYRDFAMVQPPGSMLLMVPAALGGKVFGSAWALAAARILTVGADTANIVLTGLLVRHRGALAAGVASGGYAVYPAALGASQTLFLEPWLNLFCLLGAVFLFDGDHVVGCGQTSGAAGRGGSHRALWAGACFGFATAIKIWAAVPALLAWAVCARGVRARGVWRGLGGSSPRGNAAALFAGGFAAGFAVPCLPFLILAPSGFGRTVFWSELVQATHARVGANPRLADITGIAGLTSVGLHPHVWIGAVAAAVGFASVVAAWIRARRAGNPATVLDWFALVCTVVVIGMLFSASEWYEHYAAFAGPFLVILLALSAARLFAAARPLRARKDLTSGPPRMARAAVAAGVFAAVAIAATGAADGLTVTKLNPARDLAAARALIPPGACVLTDTVSVTIVTNRFTAGSPGCPAIVDAVGTLIATTNGKEFPASRAVLAADTRVWWQALRQAEYVWLIGNSYGYTGARIDWTPALHAYFVRHFKLIGLAGSFRGSRDVPAGGLYIRRSQVQAH
jgi:alpha-1,2-mannosyltransferase